jgi:hypothetical protein
MPYEVEVRAIGGWTRHSSHASYKDAVDQADLVHGRIVSHGASNNKTDQYLVLTNEQTDSGCWEILADDIGTLVGSYDYPDDVRSHLYGLEIDTVLMDVDGHGTLRHVPLEWIGDGEKLVGSCRALSLEQ